MSVNKEIMYDEIDLKEIVLQILKYRKIIIFITLGITILFFSFMFFIKKRNHISQTIISINPINSTQFFYINQTLFTKKTGTFLYNFLKPDKIDEMAFLNSYLKWNNTKISINLQPNILDENSKIKQANTIIVNIKDTDIKKLQKLKDVFINKILKKLYINVMLVDKYNKYSQNLIKKFSELNDKQKETEIKIKKIKLKIASFEKLKSEKNNITDDSKFQITLDMKSEMSYYYLPVNKQLQSFKLKLKDLESDYEIIKSKTKLYQIQINSLNNSLFQNQFEPPNIKNIFDKINWKGYEQEKKQLIDYFNNYRTFLKNSFNINDFSGDFIDLPKGTIKYTIIIFIVTFIFMIVSVLIYDFFKTILKEEKKRSIV